MLELRPIVHSELPELLALHQRTEAFDGVPRVLSLEEMEEEIDDHHVVLATDTRVATLDGTLAGYAYNYHLPSEVREERLFVFGLVAPEHRRKGVGTALMQWAIERGEQQLRSTGRDLPLYLRVDAFDHVESAHRLFASLGMDVVRYHDELIRPLEDLPPLPAAPAGLRIVAWPDGRSEEIRLVKNEAFADHWGSTPTSAHHWDQMLHGPGARLDLSFVAEDGDGQIVAHCLCKRFPADDEITGRRDAWIDNLGTLREHRGRGVASALIAHALHAFAADGLTHAMIGVDSENPTGAARLYRSLGFGPLSRRINHQLRFR